MGVSVNLTTGPWVFKNIFPIPFHFPLHQRNFGFETQRASFSYYVQLSRALFLRNKENKVSSGHIFYCQDGAF